MKESLKKDWAFKGVKRFRDLLKPEYRYAFSALLILALVGLFFLSEYLAKDRYHVIHCGLDDLIPFNEYFIIFYILWFPFWVLMLIYTMCFEVPTFKRLMNFFILAYGICVLIFLIWPTGHDMRPETFPRSNLCTSLVKWIYAADEPRSIFPSEHVVGAFAVVFAASDSKRFSGRKSMVVITFLAVMISISITYVKQHSALDILGAAPVCAIGYFVCFYPARKRRKALEKQGVAEKDEGIMSDEEREEEKEKGQETVREKVQGKEQGKENGRIEPAH